MALCWAVGTAMGSGIAALWWASAAALPCSVMALGERLVAPAFHLVRVPTGQCTQEGRATRRTVNEAFAEVLYEGAEVRRRL